MSKKAFTLMEIMIVVVILGTLSTIAIASYNTVVYKSKAKLCALNIRGLTAAVKQYSLETGAMPNALSSLKARHLRYAYSEVFEKAHFAEKAAVRLANYANSNNAYALDFKAGNFAKYGASAEMFICPARPGRQSYALNDALAGSKWADLADVDTIIVEVEINNANGMISSNTVPVFPHRDSGFSPRYRHIGYKYTVDKLEDPNDSIAGTNGQ